MVSPITKKSLGLAVLVETTDPELSVAVGSVHCTKAPFRLVSAVTPMSLGQPVMTGLVESPRADEKLKFINGAILHGTVQGQIARGRQRERWEDNI